MFVKVTHNMTDSTVSRRDMLAGIGGAGLGATLLGTTTAGARTDRYIIGTSTPSATAAAKRRADSVYRVLDFGDIGQAVAGRFSEQALDALSNNPNVRYIERDGRMYAHQTTPWGIEKVEADVAIGDGETGSGVSIAILDTGIDAQHETLEENLGEGWAAEDAKCDADCGGGPPWASGNDIEECLEEWDDDNDHGTHVAGTAAAADNGVGVLGVAPDATLHAVKVLACDGGGSFSDVAAGINWAADQGHDVINMSLGADSESDAVSDAIENAAEENVVIVASAGNDGECTDCVGFPARHPEAIAVSATDEDDELASFSSTGPEVELAAPGVDVLSSIPRDDYAEFSGTSMSAPHVSGGAASVIASGTTDREAVRDTLKDNADDIGLDDNEQGAGRLNVAQAVDAEDDENGVEDPSLSVVTHEATSVDTSSATINGELTELEGHDEATVYFEWGESAAGLPNATDGQTLSSTASFSDELTNLDASTEYEFRAVAEAGEDSDTGDTLRFTTDPDDDEDEETTAPVIDEFELTDRSNPRWARVRVDWAVSDDDGNLDTVTSELGDGLDSQTSDVSGSSASGEHDLRERDGHGKTYDVTLTVTDTDGNSTSETKHIDL